MAILTPQQKKLRMFAYVLVGILLITGLVVYFGFFSGTTQPLVPATTPVAISSPINEIKKIKIDWTFLEGQTLQDLKFFGEHPVEPGEKGRTNPFLPI